jgi:hypothetical protein
VREHLHQAVRIAAVDSQDALTPEAAQSDAADTVIAAVVQLLQVQGRMSLLGELGDARLDRTLYIFLQVRLTPP